MSERESNGYSPRHSREKAAKEETAAQEQIGTEETADPELKRDAEGVDEPSFDYIVPEESYREHQKNRRKHRRHKHHSGKSESQSGSSDVKKDMEAESTDGYVFVTLGSGRRKRRHYNKPRMKRWKKVLLTIVCVILALVIAVGGTFFVLREIGRRGMHQYDNLTIEVPTEDESGNGIVAVDKTGRVISYNGMSYAFNDDIIALTFIGVDDGDEEEESLRMADAIYILAIDAKTGKVKILSVSRDTMTDVDIYSEAGKYIDTENRQLAYSHAYHGGNVTGGANTNKSLSRLFFGLPLENYFVINLDALEILNDSIGGVTLTSSMTFDSPEDGRTIYEGETVTLHGREATRYVVSRDFDALDANNARMGRQQEYIRAFISSILPAAKKDISVVTSLYSAVSENSETSLDLPKITYIASMALSKLRNASDIEYVSLRGEITRGANAEMRPTNEETLRVMLDVFYKPLAEVPEMTPVGGTESGAVSETAAETTKSN